eukprot:Selendium_serpulae@DN4928_c0_g2_i1.p1
MSDVDRNNSEEDRSQFIEMKAIDSVETADRSDKPAPGRVQSIHRKGPSINIDSIVEGQTLVFTPQEVYMLLVDQGVKKCNWTFLERTVHGIMGGVWIGLAGHLSTLTSAGAETLPPGIPALLYMTVFPIALIAIMVTGADLYTSNCMTVTMSTLHGRSNWKQVILTMCWSLLTNCTGTIFTAFFISWLGNGFEAVVYKDRLIYLAEKKAHMEYYEAFLNALPCNMFVCLGVLLYLAAKDSSGKFAFVWFSIAAFGLGNFEHIIANSYTIPCGMMYGANVSCYDFFIRSSLMVLLGNSLSGCLVMGVVPWILYRNYYNKAWKDMQLMNVYPGA